MIVGCISGESRTLPGSTIQNPGGFVFLASSWRAACGEEPNRRQDKARRRFRIFELSPESETLSGDTFMGKKISAEIRHQVLLLLQQGARSWTIATRLGLARSWVKRCQYCFDRGDLTWLDPTYRLSATPELALRAVQEYEICYSYTQAARVCNISAADVRRYVQNMAKFGVPLLPRGRPSASTKLAMKTASCAKVPVPVKKPKTLKSAERMLEEQRIVLESLLESMNKHLGGTDGSKKKISSLTKQLRQHIAAGYPLPNLADSPIPAGAPFIVVLETLANECRRIRNSLIESEFSKSTTKDDTASAA